MKKVSIILPTLQASQHFGETLDSVISQTLDDIEIIAVVHDGGSAPWELLRKYAARDARVNVLTCPDDSYGKAMNIGLASAVGEYIGFVEPDAAVQPTMYEELYQTASANDLDIVKAGIRFTEASENETLASQALDSGKQYCGILLSPAAEPECLRFAATPQSGIYKRSFVEAHRLRFHEAPGLAFQDIGFSFQLFACAQRVMFINKPCYTSRRRAFRILADEPNTLYAVNIEFDFIRDFLMASQERWLHFRSMYWWTKYHSYTSVCEHLDACCKEPFMNQMRKEFRRAAQLGELELDVFCESEQRALKRMVTNANGLFARLHSLPVARMLLPYLPAGLKHSILKMLVQFEKLLRWLGSRNTKSGSVSEEA